MVAETANCTVSILRGVTRNRFGDKQNAATEVTSGIPATLIDTGKQVQDPSTDTPRTIRQYLLKLPYWVEVQNTDRIRAYPTGDLFAIIDLTAPSTITSMPVGGPPDLTLTLKRITSTGA